LKKAGHEAAQRDAIDITGMEGIVMDHASVVRSVLVIDDSTVQRMHAVDMLGQLGVARVLEASHGEQALALLSELSADELPDVVMVDLEMPGLDGVQVIQRMQAQGLLLPIIVASGRELLIIHTVEAMTRSLGMPVLGGIRKPLQGDALRRLIERRAHVLRPPGGRTGQLPRSADSMGLDAGVLGKAIASGMFTMHYQPKVELQTGAVRGFEALARWPHPDLGMVPPDVFIPLAERHDLIGSLTLALMSRCFTQLSEWRQADERFKPTMAINLSPLLLGDLDLVDQMTRLMAMHDVQADQIVLEITEGSLTPNMGSALAMLARLRLKGFGLSIDDYGTGFSSMQQLAQFPFTELKIDRSFVRGVHERINLRVILQSAIDMSRQLELVSVAEGIETLEDWHTLRTMGCAIGQGYLIAKPMPGADVPTWARAWNAGACIASLADTTS
jgi:EAL domain-containing protein (putative c-di-GMP-specific phosphodiesterase class I)